ncbi:MAG: LptF/LptG family permease, partial [Cyclobacteriaceae bacterium]|nr:LptF/LptG family permease [Cyclobacteriaceae bacterium]
MKKIDKLIIGAFLGPFFLTFFVVIFILLSQFMLKYLDEIVGKDLDTSVILQLIFYFSIFMTPNAFPLAVLLSSLMTFGNLGEHFELTALKGSGISLIRTMVPIFVFTIFLTGIAYYSNNNIVPKANLKAFSLLYDVKQMKPSMELKEGAFYNGIEGYSIKVGEKYPDGKTLKDLVIYDQTAGQGNKHVTLADSGQMYNILNDRYLVLEMFNGNTYSEGKSSRKNYLAQQQPDPLVRNEFESQKIVFSLASFDLKRTKEELFSSNRLMKNSYQLKADVDSMKIEFFDKTEEVKEHSFKFFDYHLQDIVSVYKERSLEREAKKRAKEEREEEEREEREQKMIESKYKEETEKLKNKAISLEKSYDSSKVSSTSGSVETNLKKLNLKEVKSTDKRKIINKKTIPKSLEMNNKAIRQKNELDEKTLAEKAKYKKEDTIVVKLTFEENMVIIDSLMNKPTTIKRAFNKSLSSVRYIKNNMMMRNGQLDKLKTELNKFQLERNKKLSYAITILIMFFIGAPLGAIIKRGGLGVPVLISLSFFILFYVISMMCEKWTRTDVMDPFIAAWMANIILFPVGMFFMKQAKNDARLFETDFYSVVFLRIKAYSFSLKSKFKK